MSNRILKESICTSADLSPLSWFEEVLFYRLIVNCDDYGRFDGRVAVIKNRLFPLKENLTMKNVEAAINKLARAGLVSLYEVDGRPFLFLPTWDKHQTVRAKKSKYPEPPVQVHESKCTQMISNESKCPRNPIQSEYESEYDPNTNILSCADTVDDGQQSAVIALPLNTGELYAIDSASIAHWRKLYPGVDIEQELRNMLGWLEANPTRRKTSSGILKFITNWLKKEQDKGGVRREENSGNTCNAGNSDAEFDYGIIIR